MSLSMINNSLHRLSDDLINEYESVFRSKDENKIFAFLRKYVSFVENDENNYKRLFIQYNPLKDYDKLRSYMKEFNRKCWNFLCTVESQEPQRMMKKTQISGEKACYMGFAYQFGLFGQYIDYRKAYTHYTISSQLNNDLGTFRLAQCYEKGVGTNRNLSKAIHFFRCSAKLGLPDAMHVYGTILLNGLIDSNRDIKTGLHFLSLAYTHASKIYPYALYDFGKWYENKSDLKDASTDEEYAFEVYLKGALLNDSNCSFRIARAYDFGELQQPVNKNKAFEFYQNAANFGQIEAQLYLSEIFFSSVGFKGKRNPEQSYFWALKAATKGDSKAAYILGEYLNRGFGVKESKIKSLWWFMISKELGSKEANMKISEMKKDLKKCDEGPLKDENLCCWGLFCHD